MKGRTKRMLVALVRKPTPRWRCSRRSWKASARPTHRLCDLLTRAKRDVMLALKAERLAPQKPQAHPRASKR